MCKLGTVNYISMMVAMCGKHMPKLENLMFIKFKITSTFPKKKLCMNCYPNSSVSKTWNQSSWEIVWS